MLLTRGRRSTRETEGVGFEPTVGFPTLDFESSALNRTQPPFLRHKKTSNAQRPTSNAECKRRSELSVEREVVAFLSQAIRFFAVREDVRRGLPNAAPSRVVVQKMLQFWACHGPSA